MLKTVVFIAALQTEIARLKQEAYLYQMLLHEERQKMCA